MELERLYGRSVGRFAELVRGVPADGWARPTPCTDWDVRALVNHVVGEQRWSVPLFEGATIADVGDRLDGDLLGGDPVGSAGDAAAETAAVVSAPGALDRTVHLSFGDTPATEYVNQLLADHLVHGWDLAVASGADRSLDPEIVRYCAAWFADVEEMYRKAGFIGPRTSVGAGASDQDRLLAAFGRDPDWSPA
ncbi:MAG TPA: TIGR03086 family metal-binding protein [Micromonosporaceae bacterium]|nr:TIGR03086 family metal-binding protein [Micromonosporaceae bacterium]